MRKCEGRSGVDFFLFFSFLCKKNRSRDCKRTAGHGRVHPRPLDGLKDSFLPAQTVKSKKNLAKKRVEARFGRPYFPEHGWNVLGLASPPSMHGGKDIECLFVTVCPIRADRTV